MLYEFGKFRADTTDRQLWRDGQRIPLTPKAFDLLVVFLESRGKLVRKESLMQQVWPATFVEEANLAQHVAVLRRALGDNPEEHLFIQTVPKLGYRFVCPVINWQSNEPRPFKLDLSAVEPPSPAWRATLSKILYPFKRR